jgi:spermidine/putrescine transport system permease protein
MLFTPFAVQLGLLYNYLPFMVLPIYASIEKINEQCYLAAADLGAGNGQIFRHITLPLSVRGMLTGVFFVFIPTLGEYVIPDLLGGGKTDFIGNIIIRQFRGANNWPLGASMVLLMVMCILAGLLLKNIVFRKERSR